MGGPLVRIALFTLIIALTLTPTILAAQSPACIIPGADLATPCWTWTAQSTGVAAPVGLVIDDAHNQVIVGSSTTTVAYDEATGQERWHSATPGGILQLAPDASFVVASQFTGSGTTLLDTTTGHARWTNAAGGRLAITPDGAGILISTPVSNGLGVSEQIVRLIESATGTQAWRTTLVVDFTWEETGAISATNTTALLAAENQLFGLDLQNGSTLWSHRMPEWNMVATTRIVNDHVLLYGTAPAPCLTGSDAALIEARNVQTGNEEWRAMPGQFPASNMLAHGRAGYDSLLQTTANSVSVAARLPPTTCPTWFGNLLTKYDLSTGAVRSSSLGPISSDVDAATIVPMGISQPTPSGAVFISATINNPVRQYAALLKVDDTGSTSYTANHIISPLQDKSLEEAAGPCGISANGQVIFTNADQGDGGVIGSDGILETLAAPQ